MIYQSGLGLTLSRPGKVGVPSDSTLENDISTAFKQDNRVFTTSLNSLPLSRAGFLSNSNEWWKVYRLQSRTTLVFSGQTWTVWELLPRN